MAEKDEFLHPRSRYYGDSKPENVVFNASFREFAIKVDYICCLETGGKIGTLEAYEQIKTLWQQFGLSQGDNEQP
ncbi:hypothetical protein [Nostoc sp. UHCC 0251]|uniref:DUF7219 family protein n=1 Tax=Nostoc sp. UHCC 0251 TaxID=3110240 RepID=UPI002B1EEEC5|nr:hypothetical protein [Nostoc sp. UHCC 0251]MEA5627954.1 hypothetical protein [Nostoc sp. UHCC 0251]